MFRNFKNSCPKQSEKLPSKPCELGKPEFDHKGKLTNGDKICPWYINDKKYCYCFWKYTNMLSSEKGQMPALKYREIGERLALSSSTVGIIVRNSIQALQVILRGSDLENPEGLDAPRINEHEVLHDLDKLENID